jgi:colanic acid/amylovoran biosynthesis glycosyltransferase
MDACLNERPETISVMGARARARVVERHDADKEAAKLADFFGRSVERS